MGGLLQESRSPPSAPGPISPRRIASMRGVFLPACTPAPFEPVPLTRFAHGFEREADCRCGKGVRLNRPYDAGRAEGRGGGATPPRCPEATPAA